MTESETNSPPCPSCGYPFGAGHTPDCPMAVKPEHERSSEILKPVGFIQEATLPETLEQIVKIPTEKRRIIVYVGVHPNEGTDRLVKGHATEWMEKYGVLVVSQPTQETPHAIWEKRKEEVMTAEKIPALPADVILDEEDYVDKFSLENKDTFVIRFHGTPLGVYRGGESGRKRGLSIETSRYSAHPEDFKNRRLPINFSRPDIVDGLQDVLSRSGDRYENEVNMESHQDGQFWYPDSPNMLTVEYFYKGKPAEVEDPYFQKLIAADQANTDASTSELFSKENWHRQMNIGPFYLGQDVLSDEDIKAFDETALKDFEKMLEYISKRLPELQSKAT